MSLEKDITGVKYIFEDDFKGADDAEVASRRADAKKQHEKELKKKLAAKDYRQLLGGAPRITTDNKELAYYGIELEEGDVGYIYNNNGVFLKTVGGEYYILIENEDWLVDTIEEAEMILWENWVRHNI